MFVRAFGRWRNNAHHAAIPVKGSTWLGFLFCLLNRTFLPNQPRENANCSRGQNVFCRQNLTWQSHLHTTRWSKTRFLDELAAADVNLCAGSEIRSLLTSILKDGVVANMLVRHSATSSRIWPMPWYWTVAKRPQPQETRLRRLDVTDLVQSSHGFLKQCTGFSPLAAFPWNLLVERSGTKFWTSLTHRAGE